MLLLAWLPVGALRAHVVPVPALDSPVVDTTGTLDAATRGQLEARAFDLQRRKGSQLQVLIVPTIGSESIEAYALRAFETWQLGRDGVDDGVLLLVAKNDRDVRIEVGYGLEGAIPDATADRIVRNVLVPAFRAGEFEAGILAATDALVGLIDGEPLAEPEHFARVRGWDALDTALLAGMLCALVAGAAWQRWHLKWWIAAPAGSLAAVGVAALIGGPVAAIVMANSLPFLLAAGYFAYRGRTTRRVLGVIAAVSVALLLVGWTILGKVPSLLVVIVADLAFGFAALLLWTALRVARDRWKISKGGFVLRLMLFAALAGVAAWVAWSARSIEGLGSSLAVIFSILGFFAWLAVFGLDPGSGGTGHAKRSGSSRSRSSSGSSSSSSSRSSSGSSWSGGGGSSGGGGASGRW